MSLRDDYYRICCFTYELCIQFVQEGFRTEVELGDSITASGLYRSYAASQVWWRLNSLVTSHVTLGWLSAARFELSQWRGSVLFALQMLFRMFDKFFFSLSFSLSVDFVCVMSPVTRNGQEIGQDYIFYIFIYYFWGRSFFFAMGSFFSLHMTDTIIPQQSRPWTLIKKIPSHL